VFLNWDATFPERPTEDELDYKEEEPEPSAKAFLAMLESAQKLLLDAIGRLLGLKFQHNMPDLIFG
jgi:hypothetical protein